MKKLILLLFAMLLIPMASAWDVSIDNYKSYVPPAQEKIDGKVQYGEVQFWDTGQLGENTKVATYKLIENYDSLINAYAEGESTLYEDGKLFTRIEFMNGQVNSYKIYIIEGESYEVDVIDYEQVCNDVDINETLTKVCEDKEKGSHKETRYRDKEYKFESLEAGTYKWKIIAEKKINNKVDWVASSGFGLGDESKMEEFAWWDTNWGKKQEITITDGDLPIGYSLFARINKSANMNADYSDLRFTNHSETGELDYWIESSNTTSADVWIEVNSNDSIFMYYQNQTAVSSQSNINGTFVFGDDMSYVSNCSDGIGNWDSGIPSYSNGKCGVKEGYLWINGSGAGSNNMVRSKVKYNASDGYIITYSLNRTYTGAYGGYGMFDRTGTILTPQFKTGTFNNVTHIQTIIDGGFADLKFADAASATYKKYEHLFSIGNYTLWRDGVFIRQNTTSTSGNSQYISYNQDDPGELRIDNVYVRKRPYSATVSFGSELTNAQTNLVPKFNYPANATNWTSPVSFSGNATITADGNITNISLYIFSGTTLYISNITTGLTGRENSTIWNMTLPDGDYEWMVGSCGTNETGTLCNTTTNNRTFTIDTTAPSVTIYQPTASNYNINVSWLNYTATDLHLASCWLSTGNGTNMSLTNCGTNGTNLVSNEGSNTWTIWANDTLGNVNNASVTFNKDTIYPDVEFSTPTKVDGAFIATTSYDINVSANDTNLANITIRIDGNVETTLTSPNYQTFTLLAEGLHWYNATACDSYNNCNETATRNITVDITTPLINIVSPTGQTYTYRNISFNYSIVDTNIGSCWYSLNGATNQTIENCANTTIYIKPRNNTLILYTNDSANNQNYTTVHPYYFPYLGLCNSTNTLAFINFTFKNETTSAETINANIITSWTYYFDVGTSRTLSFTNTSENPSYSFCIDGEGETLNATVSITYDNTESYPRAYSENLILTNITTNKTLYLLPINSGQYVTFSIVDNLGQAVAQAIFNATLISGEPIIVTTADDLGVVIAWLNPLTAYKFTAAKTGLTTSIQTYAPVLTAYTITLGGAIPTTTNTTMPVNGEGIIASITSPTQNSLENGTTYSFNFTIFANLSNLDGYGFIVTNGSLILATASGSNPSGETLNVSLDTGQNKTFVMKTWYLVDGDYSNSSKIWYIYDSSGSDWSIKNLFTDFDTYISSGDGLFGLTKGFNLNLAIFIIILIVTGIMSYQFSLSSPAMISGIVFLQVLLFDVVFGLIESPVAKIPHFPTIFIGLIMAGLFFKEVTE